MSGLAEFHFLYPYWSLLIPVFFLVWWWLGRQGLQSQAWQHFIDERLRPFVLSGQGGENSRWLRHGLLFSSLIAVLALAGPTWQKRELPAFQAQQGLVVVLDLSLSMLSTDVTPNRINRARFKLFDLLKIRDEGQTGLVVFAGDAFAVSPLTDDVGNIIEQAKNLSPGIMPAQGSFIYRGIDEAMLLLEQAGYATGDILVIADGVGNLPQTLQSAEASSLAGYKVSVAAIGTKEGAPIPLSQNNYFRDDQGELILAKLDIESLEEIAIKGGGVFQKLSLSDNDIERFQQFFSKDKSSILGDKTTTVAHWHNEGIWLVWLLLIPLLLLFRKGYLFSIGLCAVALNMLLPQPVSAFTWDELWLNDDQRAHQALLDNKPEKAKALFKSQDWKATAAYQNGDFEESANLYELSETVGGFYNRGNALAKAGKIKEAIESYDEALAIQADHEDAKFNRDLLKKMQDEQKKNQQNQDKNQKNNEQQQDKGKQKGQEGEQNKDQQEKNKDQQGQQNQEGSEQEKESQQGEQSEEEKKRAEAQKKKAEDAKQQEEQKAKEAEAKKKAEQSDKKGKPQEELTEEQKAQARQTKQWLHQIPDDSAGLWRRKFQYQYRQRQPRGSASSSSQGQQPW